MGESSDSIQPSSIPTGPDLKSLKPYISAIAFCFIPLKDLASILAHHSVDSTPPVLNPGISKGGWNMVTFFIMI